MKPNIHDGSAKLLNFYVNEIPHPCRAVNYFPIFKAIKFYFYVHGVWWLGMRDEYISSISNGVYGECVLSVVFVLICIL